MVLRELHEREVKYRGKHRLWFDDPAMASDTARLTAQRRDAEEMKTKDGIYQLKDPEPSEQAMPDADDAVHADLLREV